MQRSFAQYVGHETRGAKDTHILFARCHLLVHALDELL